jgi:hypothetical protein
MPIIEGTTETPLLNAGTPVNGTDEVQLLTYTLTGAGSAVATAGTFKIVFDGYRTTDLAFNASAATVQAALRLLPSIGASGCTVALTAGPPRLYQITFGGGNMAKLAVPAVTIEANTLTDAALIAVDVIVTTTTPGVTATGRGSPPGKMLYDTTNAVAYFNSGTALAPVWTLLDPLGTSASAAELNQLDAVTAGTAAASKAAVLGADKELDEFHTAALYLGAAAGTLITATAAEINAQVAAAGLGADGLLRMGVARFTFDPTATAGMRTVAAHGLGVTLPQYAVVVGGFFEVNTIFTSAAGTATVALHVQGANDIQTAVAVSGAPYSTTGLKAIVPKSNTPESTGIKCTAAREITATVAVQDLTGGKLTGFLHYVVSAATA